MINVILAKLTCAIVTLAVLSFELFFAIKSARFVCIREFVESPLVRPHFNFLRIIFSPFSLSLGFFFGMLQTIFPIPLSEYSRILRVLPLMLFCYFFFMLSTITTVIFQIPFVVFGFRFPKYLSMRGIVSCRIGFAARLAYCRETKFTVFSGIEKLACSRKFLFAFCANFIRHCVHPYAVILVGVGRRVDETHRSGISLANNDIIAWDVD
jgi:hypothetical protein